MKFEMVHIFFNHLEPETFSELNVSDWLTGCKTVPGSTMDCRWFWKDHVMKIDVGNSIETDFRRITRVE